MQIPFVDLKSQYQSIQSEIDSAIHTVLDETAFIGGSHVARFAESYAEAMGVRHCIPVANGTDAIYITLKMAGIGPGDEVIVPGMTFIATATSVSLVGATPIFADIEEEYWCICPDDVEAKITEKTKAVIGVHIFGQSFSPRLREICDKHGISLVEDAAQAHGASLNGTLAGAIGDIACFSFFPSKNMAVGGEGGMITTTREDLAQKLSRLVDHGRNDALESVELGTNLRMSEVSAAIGRIQLKHVDEWTAKRRENAIDINHSTKIRPNSEHAWHQLCVLNDNPANLISRFDSAGIDARVHYPIPCNRHQVYSEHHQHEESLEICDKLAHKLVAIPVHPSISDIDIERINSVLNP